MSVIFNIVVFRIVSYGYEREFVCRFACHFFGGLQVHQTSPHIADTEASLLRQLRETGDELPHRNGHASPLIRLVICSQKQVDKQMASVDIGVPLPLFNLPMKFNPTIVHILIL